MKKIIFGLLATGLLISFAPANSNAAITEPAPTAISVKPVESPEAKALLLRLDEINTMDKSNMKFHEKKELRVEVRSIKEQLKTLDGGIYLSIGAIIIILLLVIILL